MTVKNKSNNYKNPRKTSRQKEEELPLIDDVFPVEEDLPGEAIPEEVEDNKEFITQVKEFEEQHKNIKLVNVYKLIGKPRFVKTKISRIKNLKDVYNDLILRLDKQNIIVHFRKEYPLEEKYRFITEEIFRQDVEKPSGNHFHANFIYEDFHPETILDDDTDDEL